MLLSYTFGVFLVMSFAIENIVYELTRTCHMGIPWVTFWYRMTHTLRMRMLGYEAIGCPEEQRQIGRCMRGPFLPVMAAVHVSISKMTQLLLGPTFDIIQESCLCLLSLMIILQLTVTNVKKW